MDNKRRFIFRASAAAFGGRLIRPKDIVFESAAASALTVSGGRSKATAGPTKFDEYLSVESASTSAEGGFEDPKQYLEFTYHRVEEDTLTALTTVSAELNGFLVGQKPRMTIKRLRAELLARSPRGSGQSAIRIGDVALEGVEIDGYKLIVELYTAPFQRFDTHAKLLVAADDPAFVKESGDALYMKTPRTGESNPPPAGRLIEMGCGTIYGTIVKSIRWDGPAFPNSTIEYNKVVLPDFGRAYFGELLISQHSRRLTMVRLALGSDGGGSASGGDVQDNGGWGWSI
ncbi:MAG TPA: hypothetical protein VH583_19135 [Vicinamibacterales bacterium]|jgi:hypothetical protein